MFSKHSITKIVCLVPEKPTTGQTSAIVKVCSDTCPYLLFHSYIKTWSQIPQHLGPSPWSLLLPGALPPLWLGASLQSPAPLQQPVCTVHGYWVFPRQQIPRPSKHSRWVGEGWTAGLQPSRPIVNTHVSHGWLKRMLNPCQDWGLGEGGVCKRHAEQREFNLNPGSSLLSQIRPVLSGMRKFWKPGCNTLFWNGLTGSFMQMSQSRAWVTENLVGLAVVCLLPSSFNHVAISIEQTSVLRDINPFRRKEKNLRAPLLPSLCCIYCSQNSRKQHLQNQF